MCTSTHDVQDVGRPQTLPEGHEWPEKHASWRFTVDSWEVAEGFLEGYEYYLCKEIGTKNKKVHFHALTLEHYPDILERAKAYLSIHMPAGKDGKRAPGYDRTTNGTFESALSYFLKDGDYRTTFKFPYHEFAKKWIKRVRGDSFYSLTEQNILPVIRKMEREHNRKFKFMDEAIEWLYENTDYRASRVLRDTGVPRHILDEFKARGKRGWARASVELLVPRAYRSTFETDIVPAPKKEQRILSVETLTGI